MRRRSYILAAAGALITIWGIGCSGDSAGPAAGSRVDECIDFANYVHYERAFNSNDAYKAVQSGRYVYTAVATDGVRTFDLSNPDRSSAVAYLDTGGYARDIELRDSILVVANGAAGLMTLDIRNQWKAFIMDDVQLPGTAMSVDAHNVYAYVAAAGSGVHVVDMRNPWMLAVVGSEGTASQPIDIEVAYTHLFVTDAALGLCVFSIADPTQPSFVTSVPVPGGGEAYGLSWTEPWVAVAAGTQGVMVYDVSDPTQPQVVSATPLEGDTRDVVRLRNRLYCAGGTYGVWVLDFSPPTLPLLTRLQQRGGATRVSTGTDRVLVGETTSGVLTVIDASNADLPPIESEADFPGTGLGVFDYNSAVYVCASDQGIRIVDVSPSGQTLFIGEVLSDIGASVKHLAIGDGYAYAATSTLGIKILDLREPFAPIPRDGPPIAAERTAIQGGFLLAAAGMGMSVYGIGDNGDLSPMGAVSTPGEALDVVGKPGRAFLATYPSGVFEISTADPGQPEVTADVRVFAGALGLAALLDDYILVASGGGGLNVIDVSTAGAPFVVTRLDLPGISSFVLVENDLAYVAARAGGVHVVDVSDPAKLRIVGSLPMPDQTEGVLVHAGFMLAVDGGGHLQVTHAQCR